jgi:hypothetical protein
MATIGKKLSGELELDEEPAAARSELTWNIEIYSTRRTQRYEVAEPIALPHTANVSARKDAKEPSTIALRI